MSRSAWSLSAVELGVLLLLLNGLVWGVAALNLATPGLPGRSGLLKGGDFVHFYTLGSIAAERRVDLLYATDAQHAEQERVIPGSGDYRYVPVYGPQTALLFAPFAQLPYLWAAAAWALVTALLYGACLWIFWRDCPSLQGHRLLVLLAACAFGPFWALLHHGQTSALPLVCVTGAWLAAKTNRPWWEGFALGSLIIKPQLGVAIAVVMVARREWRVVGGALAAIGFQWGIALAAFGITPFSDYIRMLLQGPQLAWQLEPRLYALHSLRGFWMLLFPQSTLALILYLLTGSAALVLAVRTWRVSVPPKVRYSVLLLAIVLVAPHLAVYELVVLAPAYLLSVDATGGLPVGPRRVIRVLLFFAYVLPWLGGVASLTHVQWSVPVFVGWLVALHWVGLRHASDGNAGWDLGTIGPRRTTAGCTG
jgi:hypothetical protein